VATDPHPRYLDQNQPMLRAGDWEQLPASTIGNLGRQVFSDWPPAEDRLASIVRFWLTEVGIVDDKFVGHYGTDGRDFCTDLDLFLG
jgi:hypothetical protein